jgi:hypothetical protein
VALLAACGTTPTQKLQSEALSLRDLPAGWQANTGPYASAPTCFAPADGATRPTLVRARFKRGTVYIDEALRHYSGDHATLAYDAAALTLAGCNTVSIDATGVTYTGQLVPIGFPHLGDESAAYRLQLHTTAAGVVYSYTIDLIFARKGQTDLGLEYVSSGVVDGADLQALAAKAVGKLA